MKPLAGLPRRAYPKRAALAALLAVLAALPLGLAAADSPPAATADSPDKAIDRANFFLKYPSDWKEDTTAKDYKADNNFTLNSAHNSYIQFNITSKADDLQKVLDNAVFNLDGLAITTLSKSPLDQWGGYKGKGVHLKGKILDSYPGGIRVFVFNTAHYNVLVVEFYYSQELDPVLGEMDFIDQNFKMKD
jgi:hypothetical protein